MSLPIANAHAAADKEATDNLVREIADELLHNVIADAAGVDPSLRGLLERALSAASDAQRVIRQRDREIDRLRHLSSTDDATGLLNRRGFSKALKRALLRAERYGEHGLLMIVDLDGFKAVNDTFGHAAGDHVLRAVANVLTTCVRETDDVARIGGDEFAILLSPTDAATARAATIEHTLNGLVAPWQGQSIQVRASIGTSVIEPGVDPTYLFETADADMYANKRRATLPLSHTSDVI